MPKMKAMDAAVRILESEGVKHIFGIPGAGILPFYRSLKDLGTIGHMVCRHEEGAIHMADGYARAINTVGVCAATSGPGASNFVTGLYTAQVDSRTSVPSWGGKPFRRWISRRSSNRSPRNPTALKSPPWSPGCSARPSRS